MYYNKEMSNVLDLQKMQVTCYDALTSNLSFICKKNSTISIVFCLPPTNNN